MTTEPQSAPTPDVDVDVLIVGAGISGIGAAYHLTHERPGTTYAIVEARDTIGGTWSLFRYPGIRSDSDLHTFGFGFKPWTHENAIAEAPLILDYLHETIRENGIDEHIRFGHRVTAAAFSSATALWTVQLEEPSTGRTAEVTARFLFSGTGYYDYDAGYTPEFAGVEDFEGPVVHPQHWPDDLDYAGKRIVVIGSGATAVTLIPSLTPHAGRVTMLQRSPSYVLSLPSKDPIANALNRVLPPEKAFAITRRKNVAMQRGIYRLARRYPKAVRKVLMADVRRRLPRGYDVDTHFSPRYEPWDQRLCVVPDGDLFRTIKAGKADVVTDHIDHFTPGGIKLRSGRELEADIVVTATGLNLKPLGGIALEVDGAAVDLPSTTVYKSMMLSDVPNFAFALGYTNSSWTLKVDLVCEHFCRILAHMAARGQDVVVPRCDDESMERRPLLDLTSGYVQRAIGTFPRAGTRGAWDVKMAYEHDVERLRTGPVEDPSLHFSAALGAEVAAAGEPRG